MIPGAQGQSVLAHYMLRLKEGLAVAAASESQLPSLHSICRRLTVILDIEARQKRRGFRRIPYTALFAHANIEAITQVRRQCRLGVLQGRCREEVGDLLKGPEYRGPG